MSGFLRISILLLCLLFLEGKALSLCVNVPDANLRKGPGTGYEKTWEVFRYMPFEKISVQGNWFKVKDLDGDIHWIYNKLVTEDFKCAAVKVDKANIRTGPGTQHSSNALSPVQKYDSFKILENKSSWVKVADEFGDTGWISEDLLWIQ